MAKKSNTCEKYRCDKKVTLDWKNFNKFIKDNSTYGYGMGVNDLPKYFINKTKKSGYITIWFEIPGESTSGYSVSNEILTAHFPAYFDNDRLIVVIDPVKITGGKNEWSREIGSQMLDNVLGQLNGG